MTPTSNCDTGSSLPESTLCEKCGNGTLIDPHFLRTGYVPSQLEVMQMKEAIEEERRQLDGVQEEQCLCLSERIQQRRSIVSAVRRVPFELWQDIFYLLCEEPNGYSFKTITSFERNSWRTVPISTVISVPHILSGVCSLWREIVSKSPSLWSSFHIGTTALCDPQICIPLATHLHNSRNFPFTLCMCPVRNVFRMVLPHLWRCRVLDLRWGSFPELLEDVVEDLQPFNFTHLTELRLDLELPGLDPYEPFWKAISEAPMLRCLYTYSIPDPYLFPCHQLTELQVRFVYDAEVMLDVLSVCKSSLQSLYFDNFVPLRVYWHVEFSTTDLTDPPLVMPCLQHLRVNMYTFPNDVFPFFIDIVFPDVKEARVELLLRNLRDQVPSSRPVATLLSTKF
ncbi:hypothetical protein L218DRAFT_677151 [Marasmius fiardii PR-910]|nr:hypothetical protein L218DRAFT_677151 [Marasmius fiardii PR-910]